MFLVLPPVRLALLLTQLPVLHAMLVLLCQLLLVFFALLHAKLAVLPTLLNVPPAQLASLLPTEVLASLSTALNVVSTVLYAPKTQMVLMDVLSANQVQ